MSEFLSGSVSATTSAAVKVADVPACPGGASVVLQVRSGTGVYVGHNSAVGSPAAAPTGLYVNNGERLELPVTVPDGQTAPIWVRGAGSTSAVAFFVGAAV